MTDQEFLDQCPVLPALPAVQAAIAEVKIVVEELHRLEAEAWARRAEARIAFHDADLAWRQARYRKQNFTGLGSIES